MLGMIPNTQKSVVVDYITFPLEDNEICLGYREWCELFSCGVKTCRKFFDFLEENELISRRIIRKPLGVRYLEREIRVLERFLEKFR